MLANNGTLALGTFNVIVSGDYANASFGIGNGFNARANVTGSGTIDASGNVAQALTGDVANGTSAAPTLSFGNLHVGDVVSRQFQVANIGSTGPSLRGALQTNVNGGNITDTRLGGSGVTAGNFGPLATGAATSSFGLTLTGSFAGALTGQVVHLANNFDNVAEQNLQLVNSAVYRFAVASAHTPEPINFGNRRVGDSASQVLTLANTAVADGFSEALDASFGVLTGNATTNDGSFNLLAAGANNSTTLSVGIDTASAGAKSGTATLLLASNGSGTSNLGVTALPTQTVNVSGSVFRLAQAGAHTPEPVVFGNRHLNDVANLAVTISNVAANDGFSERLNAGLGNASAGFAASGDVQLLGAGSTNSTRLNFMLDTASVGVKAGTATLQLASDGTGTSGFSSLALTSQTVTLSGTVYRLASANTIAPVNFGAVHVGDVLQRALTVQNTAAADGFSERLSVRFANASDARILLSGNPISGLAAGATDNSSLVVGVDTSSPATLVASPA